jgi:hypothetical protein
MSVIIVEWRPSRFPFSAMARVAKARVYRISICGLAAFAHSKGNVNEHLSQISLSVD